MRTLAVFALLTLLAGCNAETENTTSEGTLNEETSVLNMGGAKTLPLVEKKAGPEENLPQKVDVPKVEETLDATADPVSYKTIEEHLVQKKADRAAGRLRVMAEEREQSGRSEARRTIRVQDVSKKNLAVFKSTMPSKVAPSTVVSKKAGSTLLAVKANTSTFANTSTLQVLCTPKIKTVAGNGNKGFTGDSGPAKQASLCLDANENSANAVQIAVDQANNLYIPDSCNNRIRKVYASSGEIETIAGNGGKDYRAQYHAADPKQVSIFLPEAVAFDHNGNLLIGSYPYIHRIPSIGHQFQLEEVDFVLSTIAGDAYGGWKYSGEGGPAIDADFASVSGMAFDSHHNLFFSDPSNHMILKIDTNGTITRIAGNGSSGFSGDNGPAKNAAFDYPAELMFDSEGHLYVADQYNGRIRKIEAVNGFVTPNSTITTFASGLSYPSSIVKDKFGNLIVSEEHAGRIRRINQGGQLTLIAGGGDSTEDDISALEADLNHPTGLAFDSNGDLYFMEPGLHRVRKIDMDCSDQNPEEVETPK